MCCASHLAACLGSSPLTRGKPDLRLDLEVRLRLIPAHAGKTSSQPCTASGSEAHPRSRGENLLRQSSAILYPGSSPLTRGKRRSHSSPVSVAGLIPAHAGKTCPRITPRSGRRAHPRSRGENNVVVRVAHNAQGSSPLTRGKRGNELPHRLDSGLIPAHAGKTPPTPRRLSRLRAHPRSRGENYLRRRSDDDRAGSSPLTRGKPGTKGLSASREGLIPAHAGKTRPRIARGCGSRAHPRSRGENLARNERQGRGDGSSPLTRGKPTRESERLAKRGLIPAHAGKTEIEPIGQAIGRAHPRSRGENTRVSSCGTRSAGSSPLTRGKHIRPSRRPVSYGLIPAHAGKTHLARCLTGG